MTCKDEDIGKLIGSYELGILTEDEKKQFEDHLLDCECMNIVFACKAGIINTARDPSKTQPEVSTASTSRA